MQRMILFMALFFGLMHLPAAPATAGFFDSTLVSIDGKEYVADDFKNWWKFWNTEKEPLPATPDGYIDWLLLAREGERMELDEDPGFKRQTRIYLQSRGLLMLKYEAVDSRIKVTDEQIRARYRQQDLPRWLVQRIIFKDEETAMAAWQEVSSGAISVAQLLERKSDAGGPVSTNENWVRPSSVDPGWSKLFRDTAVGKIVPPEGHDKGAAIYYMKEQKGEDAEDLAAQRELIKGDLWKEQEGALTQALLDELYKKYKVSIDQKRLDAMDLNAADDTFTDAPVITTNRDNVSEKQFIAVIRRLQNSRTEMAHAVADADKSIKLKADTVENIIAQSLTNWESLDRHFEEREPFKFEYQFNYNHRLVLAVEQRLFADQAKVTDEQIEKHYQEYSTLYTQPTVAKLYIVDETQGPIDGFWAEVAVGKDFKQVLLDHFKQRVQPQQVPVNHLDPEVKAVVEKLVKGETSQIFTSQGIRVMVHLEELTPEKKMPLERVKESIRSRVWQENLDRARKTFLDEVKSRSKIEVKERQWKSLQKELGGV